MNSTIWKQLVKTGSFVMIFCFSLSFFFGEIAEASDTSTHKYMSQVADQLSTGDAGNYNVGFGINGANSIYSDTSSNVVNAKVHVRSYHRKDGTYVRSHYRRNPR
jgi:hypothetical protein